MEEIYLSDLNMEEACRYLGFADKKPDDNSLRLLKECEREVLGTAVPRYVYRVFDIEECDEGVRLVGNGFLLPGNSIKKHLGGCKKAVLFAATISENIDRLLRIAGINDMARQVFLDSLSSVAIEQVCDTFEMKLKKEFPEYYQTFRYGIGYGDLPITLQEQFLKILNAQRLIGLTANQSSMLIPTKSVTAIIGLSKTQIKSEVRGCQTCSLGGRCKYRAKGQRCNG